MNKSIREKVCAANKLLPEFGLVTFTWGNVSQIDRDSGTVYIKPSGVDYGRLEPEDMVAVSLETGESEGKMSPSSDTPTHLEIYRAFPQIGAIVHTHSCFATAFAQAHMAIPPLGTTHADYFYGEIPCTRELTKNEVTVDYELNTGRVVVQTFARLDPIALPGVLVASHGVFAWGDDAMSAVHNAKVIEEVAHMAVFTLQLGGGREIMPKYILDKHYFRKHGESAYYGQKES